MQGLNGRYYAGKVIVAEFSPVTDFREAKCRQYNEGQCDRGGYCNFMHPKHVTRDLKKQLFKAMYDDHPDYREDRKNRTKNSGDVKPVTEKRKSRSRSAGKNDRDNRGSDRRDRDRKRSRSRSGERKHSRRSRSREHRRRDSRERRPDSRDRHRDRRDRDRRDSKSRRGGDENGSKRPEESSSKVNSGRMNSEERRAMIAKWNAEEEKDNKQ